MITVNYTTGVLTIVCYSLFYIAAMSIAIALPYAVTRSLSMDYSYPWCTLVIDVVATGFYFYGDNIYFVVQNYGGDIGCNFECIRNNRIFSVLCLGIALIIRHLVNHVFKDFGILCNYNDGVDTEEPVTEATMPWTHVLKMFSDIHKMDTLYTAVALAAQSAEFCSYIDVSLSWSLYIVCCAAGILSLIIRGVLALKYEDHDYSKAQAISTIICVILCIILPLYLLTDNEQPFDCAFGCDSFATNVTGIIPPHVGENCNLKADFGTRFALMVIVMTLLVVAIYLFVLLFDHTNGESKKWEGNKSLLDCLCSC